MGTALRIERSALAAGTADPAVRRRKRDVNDGLAIDIVDHVRSFVSQDPQPRFGRETAQARAASRFRSILSFPIIGPALLVTSGIAVITGILSLLGGEQFSPYAVFFYLAATVVIGLKFGTILAVASSWLSAVIGGIVLYEPTFTLTIDNPVSMRSLIAFVCVAMTLSIFFHRAKRGLHNAALSPLIVSRGVSESRPLQVDYTKGDTKRINASAPLIEKAPSAFRRTGREGP